jgi:hypothetical protein
LQFGGIGELYVEYSFFSDEKDDPASCVALGAFIVGFSMCVLLYFLTKPQIQTLDQSGLLAKQSFYSKIRCTKSRKQTVSRRLETESEV